MTQVLFSAATSPLGTDLDANFTELYGRTALLTVASGRNLLATVGGSGNPFMATGQSSDIPYYEFQKWSGSGSNYYGVRIQSVSNGGLSINLAPSAAVGSQVWTEAARFDASGNLLIGKTSQTVTAVGFQALPNGAFAGTYSAASSGGEVMILARGINTGNLATFTYNGSTVGSISTSGSSTAYNTSSDYRLKDDVAPIANSGNFIDALRPVTWAWKIDGSAGAGFIAHELQAVSPSSVTGTKDAVDAEGNPIYQAVEYGSAEVIAMLVAEVKDLRRRVAAGGL